MREDDNQDDDELPVSERLLSGPIDYDFLKAEIEANGPIRQTSTQSDLQFVLNITPCLCGFENCVDDVIIVGVQHGLASFRSSVQKEELISHKSLSEFFHNFFHYPEAIYCSSADEQQIEYEVVTKLGLDPFAVYAAEDTHDEIVQQFSGSEKCEADFWQAHNLIPLLRILAIKRKLRKWARKDADGISGEECFQLVNDVFDIGFLAGRLWSEYKTKENLEEVVEKGEASISAQRKRTEASGQKSANTRKQNLELFLKEIESLSDDFPKFSEEAIVRQAYTNAAQKQQMPTSSRTRDDYGTALRSEEPFKSRYEAVFRNNA